MQIYGNFGGNFVLLRGYADAKPCLLMKIGAI